MRHSRFEYEIGKFIQIVGYPKDRYILKSVECYAHTYEAETLHLIDTYEGNTTRWIKAEKGKFEHIPNGKFIKGDEVKPMRLSGSVYKEYAPFIVKYVGVDDLQLETIKGNTEHWPKSEVKNITKENSKEEKESFNIYW